MYSEETNKCNNKIDIASLILNAKYTYMSYSDFERRIKRLYISIDTLRELTTILQPEPTQNLSYVIN